ncbi:MAG: DUF5106 domain-containing protein [Rikenellaceae bacterium]
MVAAQGEETKVQQAQQTPNSSSAAHIWGRYDLSSVDVINSPEFEQEWATFLFATSQQQPHIAYGAIKESMKLSESNPEALNALFELGEKYLYNPNSPMRNDELFIPMLEFMIDSPAVEPLLKIRPQSLLKRASLNRIGRVANDFEIAPKRRMHQVEAPFTLLYFYDPDCSDCKRTSAIIKRSELLEQLKANGSIEVVATLTSENMAVDSLYDLKAIPSLYLLDEQKRVLLKDAPIETIIESLQYIQNK